MKKITVVDAIKVNNYVDSVSINQFSVGTLLHIINSGKNKYEIPDVFNYLVDYVYNNLEQKKPTTNNKLKKYIYAISAILQAYNNINVYIGDDISTKIKALEGLYVSNRSLTGKDGDDTLIEFFEKIKDGVSANDSYKKLNNDNKEVKELKEDKPVKKSSTKKVENIKEKSKEGSIIEEKSSEEYESIIAKLKAKVSLLEDEVAEYEKAMKVSSSQNNDDQKKINQLNQKINKAKSELNSLRKKSKKDDAEKEKLNKDINKLNDKLEKLNRTFDDYAFKVVESEKKVNELLNANESLKQEIINSEQTIISLSERIDKQEEKLKESKLILENATTKQDQLDDFILGLLFSNKLPLDTIVGILEKNGFDVTKQDVLDSLKRINQIVNVRPRVAFDKKYGVIEPAVRTNQKLTFPNNTNKLDIMFLADYHYDASQDSAYYLQEKLNSVYDYCASNNIKTIITLGDLLDNKNVPLGVSKENFEIIRNLLKDFDKILPYDVNVKHFVLGGNHDRSFLKYGIDPIEELSFEREDTIPLGYSNAYMFFGGADVLGLHHEGVPRESFVPNYIESGKEVKENLEKAYDNARVNINERYFDLFGHFHKARLDIENGFGIVPSLASDRNADGAWHITFEIDNNGRIKNMIINSLVFGKSRELRTTNEIVYQRKK